MTFYPIQGDVQYHLAGDPMQGELADGFPVGWTGGGDLGRDEVCFWIVCGIEQSLRQSGFVPLGIAQVHTLQRYVHVQLCVRPIVRIEVKDAGAPRHRAKGFEMPAWSITNMILVCTGSST